MTTVMNRKGQTLDVAAAMKAADRVNAINKQCYWNAWKTLKALYRGRADARYVEGHAVCSFGLPMEHAWVELDDGATIVDPTPAWHDSDADQAPATAPVYFGALRYSPTDLKGKRMPKQMPMAHYPAGSKYGGFAGWRNPDYKAASDAAHVFVWGVTPDQMMANLN